MAMAPGMKPSDTVRISKALSYLLRHAAEKEGFKLLPGGYLYVDDILQKKRFHTAVTEEDIRSIVETNDKKRFTMVLDEESKRLKIRANQGHSMQVEDLDLKPILNAEEFPIIVHGTYHKYWQLIASEGLKRMNRNHIHFAPGLPGEDGVISGGLKFFLSANNVVLCPGDESGVVGPYFFHKVVDRRTGKKLPFPGSAEQPVEKKASTLWDDADTEETTSRAENLAVTAEDIDREFQDKRRRKKKNKKDGAGG